MDALTEKSEVKNARMGLIRLLAIDNRFRTPSLELKCLHGTELRWATTSFNPSGLNIEHCLIKAHSLALNVSI